MTQFVVLLAALPAGASAAERATADRPDDVNGPQVHLLYVLPAGGVDRGLDGDDTIARSFDLAQGWLQGQSDGRALRLDTVDGAPDVTFFRLPDGDASREGIERSLAAAGFGASGKRYLAYVDGAGPGGCSAAAWPGRLAVLYLRAEPCAATPLRRGPDPAGLWEHTALREVFRTLGAVATCAPNDTGDGHVADSPTDLMYAGPEPWAPARLDAGRDDYFGHGRAGCLDLADSTFLERRPPGVVVSRIVVTRRGPRVRAALTVRCPERCRVSVALSQGGRRFAGTGASLERGARRRLVLAGRATGAAIQLAVVARDELGKVTRVAVRRRPRAGTRRS